MSDDTQSGGPQRLNGARSTATSAAADELDMAALVAAVERLLRRDLELERERLRGAERGEMW